jgi:hypothetical protein
MRFATMIYESSIMNQFSMRVKRSSSHRSHHLFLYNSRSSLSVDFACKRWVRKKFFVCKKNFKKCNLRLSIAFERVEMMKNRSQLMFCVRVSQAAIQKQRCKITWCNYAHVTWLEWLCIERDNFNSSISTYIVESLILE